MKFRLFLVVLICILYCCKKEPLKIKKIKGQQVHIEAIYKEDSSLIKFIEPYKNKLSKEVNTVLCYNKTTLSRKESKLESSLGNLYADVCFLKADSIFTKETGNHIDFALFNYGGIRTAIPKGEVQVSDIFKLMPFENKLVVVKLDGKKMENLLNYLKTSKLAHPISNIKLELRGGSYEKIEINDIPFNNNKSYYVLTHDYLQHGGDSMFFFMEPLSLFNTQYKVRDALIDYFKTIDTIYARLDNRFIAIK